LFIAQADDPPTHAGSAGILRTESESDSRTIGAGFIRGKDIDLYPSMAILAGGYRIELSEWVFPCPVAEGAGDFFGGGKGSCSPKCL